MKLHFRTLPNGHYAAFRVVEDTRARPSFQRVGSGNVNKDVFHPDEQNPPTEAEQARIAAYVEEARALDAEERRFELRRLPMKMRQAMFLVSEASSEELDQMGESLLFALYDLRESLTKRRLELAEAEIDRRVDDEVAAEKAAEQPADDREVEKV